MGPAPDRGAFVVSGANGIVGAGKTMQLGSRLAPYDVPIVGLDFPSAPDGIGRSRLASKIEQRLGVTTTSRNWRTVCKLVDMLQR